MEEDTDRFYLQEVEAAVKGVSKQDVLLVIGNFNEKAWKRASDTIAVVVGADGFVKGNKGDERLLDLCKDHEMSLCNIIMF